MTLNIVKFIKESNRIEGIDFVSAVDIEAHKTLLSLPELKAEDIQRFVSLVANAELRDRDGMNVRVGNHAPYGGGPLVKSMFENLIAEINAGIITSYYAHHRYETLHPFMDGNGRSGRAIWLWMEQRKWGEVNMQDIYDRGFLHSWYYQSLSEYRKGKLK